MKLSKKKIDLRDCLNKEWIITNGLGGFCSSTVIGANTRRYHGLLVAPLIPPAQRHLLVSKVDEKIEVNGEEITAKSNSSNDKVGNEWYVWATNAKTVKVTYTVNGIEYTETFNV